MLVFLWFIFVWFHVSLILCSILISGASEEIILQFYFGLFDAEVRGVSWAFKAAILHGLCWQLQSLLSVYLSFISTGSVVLANGLQAGLNVGIHSASITIFCMILARCTPRSCLVLFLFGGQSFLVHLFER